MSTSTTKHRQRLAARPAHRQGVRYNNVNVQQRFGNNNPKALAGDRMDFRGRDRQNQGAARLRISEADHFGSG